ncbi:putative alpha,alpha-trehalose-phosphate synthase 7-like [Hibiscus syriacus]|uniref:Alpha,alpha-trehalose-phosphate synthase 7-like n=1 Tax=Hibiscus syriacus TaxID=106335 RepID=A0A6A2Z9X0_HIBSY|nr:protein GRAVITROPIC IN THE LIGHT 1-like [Hibiscus syriacus]KAE8688250.1 putative alpha,alpha-trehalose-phosphate synthase 7-like [Hibiscus syriacus]
METIKPKLALRNNNNQSRLARTFQRVINLRSAKKIVSSNGVGICVLTASQHKLPHQASSNEDYSKAKQKAVMEALLAKVFAGVTSIKVAYAELQMAQHPYNSEAIQASDQAVVEELRALSELKGKFLKKELDLSPQVTLMLAEIQEQQSLMRTYEITIKKLQSDVEEKSFDICLLHKRLQDCTAFNKSLETKLNAKSPLSMFDDIQFTKLNPGHFVQVLHFSLRSARGFVKMMVKEMESAKWDLGAAAETIESVAVFAKESHRCFAFDSFVCKTMLEGFNSQDFGLSTDSPTKRLDPEQYFNAFKNMKSAHPKSFLVQNPNSCVARFIRTKYLNLVHAKMECSFFGNLNQRKLVTSGGFPDTAFFTAFAEMSRRFWLLHCLGFSMHQQVSIFQVKKYCGFSEVYMENVSDESLLSGEINGANADVRVGFTVVPGFKIGATVIQSQVYLSPVITPPVSR